MKASTDIRGVLLILLGFMTAPLSFSEGPLLLVGFEDYEPFQRAGDPPSGLDIELTRIIVERAGYTAEFVRQPWARQLESLKSGRLDIMMCAAINDERRPFAQWTKLYRPMRMALIAAEGGAPHLSSLQDLKDRDVKIGAVRGVNYTEKYGALEGGQRLASKFVYSNNNLSLVKMLFLGRIAYILADPLEITYTAVKEGLGKALIALELPDEPSYLMVGKVSLQKYPGLLEALDKAIGTMEADGTRKKILGE